MNRNEILEIVGKFRRLRQDQFGILRTGVFGSAARDTMSDTSDVDVVVELANPDLFAVIGVKQELEDLLGRPVDVVRYRDRMNTFLKRRIEQEAVYV